MSLNKYNFISKCKKHQSVSQEIKFESKNKYSHYIIIASLNLLINSTEKTNLKNVDEISFPCIWNIDLEAATARIEKLQAGKKMLQEFLCGPLVLLFE